MCFNIFLFKSIIICLAVFCSFVEKLQFIRVAPRLWNASTDFDLLQMVSGFDESFICNLNILRPKSLRIYFPKFFSISTFLIFSSTFYCFNIDFLSTSLICSTHNLPLKSLIVVTFSNSSFSPQLFHRWGYIRKMFFLIPTLDIKYIFDKFFNSLFKYKLIDQ